MKYLSFLLCLTLFGCAPAQYSAGTTVDPVTGAVSVTGNISGTFGKSIVEGRSYGRAIDPIIQGRGLRSVDECSNVRAFEQPVFSAVLSRDTIRQTAKYDKKDLETRWSREHHNAKVMQDNTIHRSMWSSFSGFFGFHRKLQPLPECPLPLAETVTLSPVNFNPPPPVAEVLPSATEDFTVPPAAKSPSNLESRVTALEANVNSLNAKADKILAKLSR